MTPHELATDISKDFFRKATDERLTITDTLIAVESFVTVALMFVADQDKTITDKRGYATALLDAMTENAAKTINEIYLEKAE